VVLPLAQLYTQQQKHDLAVEVLAKLPLSSRTQPTTVEAIVNLHQRQKSPDKAVACLREAIKYWSSQEEESETLAQVVRIAARLAMQLKDRAFAAEATCSDDGGLAQSLRSPELRVHKQASDTARSPARQEKALQMGFPDTESPSRVGL
ncbi:unnamed protein product, partial [Symbiodinium necroappetens]